MTKEKYKEQYSVFDPSEFLDSEEAIHNYLSIALLDYDDKTFSSVLNTIAKARIRNKTNEETSLKNYR